MLKDGSVAPKERINITFKPAIGGVQEEVELPLKLLVLGDFSHREDLRKLEDRKPIGIDKNTLDEVLAKQALSLTLSVRIDCRRRVASRSCPSRFGLTR